MKQEKKGRRAASLGVPEACEMFTGDRNTLKRIGLSWGMRILIAIAFVLIPMQAMSLKDFNAKPAAEQSAYVASFIDSMAGKLEAKNPQLATDIRDWFSRKPAGKPVSEGIEKLYVELTAAELRAKDGKADLSKIELESVIMYVTRQHFPPPAR